MMTDETSEFHWASYQHCMLLSAVSTNMNMWISCSLLIEKGSFLLDYQRWTCCLIGREKKNPSVGEEEGSHRSHCITHCTCWFSETQEIAAGAEDTRQNHCCLDATVKSKLCAVVRKDRHCGGVNGDQIAKVFLVAVYLPYRKYGLEVTRRTLNPLCCLLIYSYWANINCQCWSEMQIWSRAQWTRTCGNLQLGDGFPSTFRRSHGPKTRTSAD